MPVIVTKNSSTASAVPTSSDLVQGELAVNVADKRLFTEDNSAQIIELGTNPTSITTGAITASGTVTANGQFVNGNALLTGGSINNIIIGNSTAAAVTGTVVTASTGFVGGLTGNVVGNLSGNTSGGTHTGPVVGDLQGNVTASSGTTSLHNLSLTGTVDFNTARLTDIGTPLNATDAVTKLYADNLITNLIDGAPAALDTLNELAAAMADDATFHTTVTNSIATKLPLAGGALSGNLAMGTNKITGLADPTSAQDAATRSFVLAQAGAGLPTSGGTMTGDIAMSTNKITGLGDPTSAQDASSKAYTDSILGSSTAAATSAAAALVSQNAAATSAATATTQAGISTTKAGESSTSATSAASSLTSFNAKYLGASATVPSGTAAGQLYFNTTSNTMFVYSGSSWAAAGSAVNGTAERQEYTATAGQTSFNATYDVGFVDVYLNGSKLIPTTDFSATNGSQVVLLSPAALGDNVSIIAYGAFNVADVYTQSQSNARYMQLANNLSDVASAPTALTNLGLTADAAEINKLDGMNATKTELNYLSGVTSNIQTQINNVGGGNEASFVASGAISSKAPVILKSDGKAEAISQTTITTASGTPALMESGQGGDYPGMCYHESENCVVMGYSDRYNNYYGTIVCGTVNADKTITWDWANRLVHFSTAFQTAYYHSLVYSERGGNNRVGVFFRGDQNYGYCQVISVSGTTASATGAIQKFSNNYLTVGIRAAIDSTTSNTSTVMVSYKEGSSPNKQYLRAFEVGSSSMSFGSEYDMTSSWMNSGFNSLIYHTPTSQFCVFGRDDNNSYYGEMGTITSSGTTVSSVNNVTTFDSNTVYQAQASYDSNADKILLSWASTGSTTGKCLSVSCSGTTLSLGGASPTNFDTNNITSTKHANSYDPIAKKAVIIYNDTTDTVVEMRTAALSASDYTVTLGSAVTIQSITGGSFISVYDPDTGLVACLYEKTSSSGAGQNNFWSTAIQVGYDNTNLTSTNFLGIADAAINDTATGAVILEGAVIEGLSSLTIGATYYVLPTGVLSTSNTGTPSVTLGMAISATAINMRGAT